MSPLPSLLSCFQYVTQNIAKNSVALGDELRAFNSVVLELRLLNGPVVVTTATDGHGKFEFLFVAIEENNPDGFPYDVAQRLQQD